MDPRRFDTLTRTLSTSGTRRNALTALLAGSLGLLRVPQMAQGRKRRAERDVTIQGPCGDGSGPANVCERPADCCTGICERTAPGKAKRCRCRHQGQACTRTRNCCQGAGQDLLCAGGTCQPPCTSGSCATGCCDGVSCQEGTTNAACGEGGSCVTCSSDAGVSCRTTDGVNGTCVRDCASDGTVCGGGDCICNPLEGGGNACVNDRPGNCTCFPNSATCAAGCPSDRVCLDQAASGAPCTGVPGQRACCMACAAT